MNLAKLPQLIQSAIIRHEQWLADHITAIACHEQWKADHEAATRRIDAQQELNIQAIAQFTAGLEELRVLDTN
jgi:DNA-directed RNA polymerase